MATVYRHEATDQTIRIGKAWRDDNGVLQPPNWDVWSAKDRTSAGITEIVQDSPPDSRLYDWSYNADGTVSKTAKTLSGVKSDLKTEVNAQQKTLLDESDWCVIRKADKGTAIPSHIQTWRDAIRTKGDAMGSAIAGAANTNAVEALFVVYESDGTTVKSGILYDWPVLET